LAAPAAWHVAETIRLITAQQEWFEPQVGLSASQILENWLNDTEIQGYLGINRYKGVLWFNQEAFETFLWWMMMVVVIRTSADPKCSAPEAIERMVECYDIISQLLTAEKASGFQINGLIEALKAGSVVS
jgi:hypothetical protein